MSYCATRSTSRWARDPTPPSRVAARSGLPPRGASAVVAARRRRAGGVALCGAATRRRGAVRGRAHRDRARTRRACRAGAGAGRSGGPRAHSGLGAVRQPTRSKRRAASRSCATAAAAPPGALIIDVAAGARRPPDARARPAAGREIALRRCCRASAPTAPGRPTSTRARSSSRRSCKGAPRVAILVGGLGIDAAGTRRRFRACRRRCRWALRLMAAISSRIAARAREAGHEILLQAPMEPFGAPADPGPHMLTSSAGEAENRESLQWMMGRFTGLHRRRELSRRQIHRRLPRFRARAGRNRLARARLSRRRLVAAQPDARSRARRQSARRAAPTS